MSQGQTREDEELEKLLGPPSKSGAVPQSRESVYEGMEEADPFGWKAEEKNAGLLGGKYLDPNSAAAAGGISLGVGTGIGAGALSVNPVVGAGAGFATGVVGAEAARQYAYHVNRKRGATSPNLIGPDGMDMRVLEASANMLTDATLTALTGGLGSKGVKAGARATLLKSTPGAKTRLMDFEKAGVPPSMGAVTQNRFVQGAESVGEKMLGSWDISREAKQARLDAMRKNFVDIVSESNRVPAGRTGSIPKGAKSAYEGGEAIQRAGIIDRSSPDFPISYQAGMDKQNNVLRAQLASVIGTKTPVDTAVVESYISGLYPNIMDQGVRSNLITGDLKAFAMALQAEKKASGGKITWGALDDLRQKVGRDMSVVGDRDQATKGELKGLYKAISDSQRQVAESKGAGDALNSYNDWYTTAASFRDELAQRIKSADPEKIFKSANSAEVLRGFKKEFQPGEWHDFKTAKMVELGGWNPDTGKVGDFNPRQLTTNLTNLRTKSPESFDILIEPGTPLRENIERYLRVNSYLKDADFAANPSGTAYHNFIYQTLSGFGQGVKRIWQQPSITEMGKKAITETGGGVLHFGAMFFGARRMQTFFSDPKAIRWMADSATIPPGDYNGMFAHLGKLSAIEWAQPEIRDEMRNFAASMKSEIQRQQTLEKREKPLRDEAIAKRDGTKAAQLAKNILMLQDQISKVERDKSISVQDKKRKLAPVYNAMNSAIAKRNILLGDGT